MSLINSDIIFDGELGAIMKNLVKEKVYNNNVEIFVEASLIGLYAGKTYEPINSEDTDTAIENRASISRTVFQKTEGSKIAEILFAFLQHEKIYNDEAIPVQEVFIFSDDQENRELLKELKKYSNYGILEIGKKWEEFLDDNGNTPKTDIISEMDLLDTKELKNLVAEEQRNRISQDSEAEVQDLMKLFKESRKNKGN